MQNPGVGRGGKTAMAVTVACASVLAGCSAPSSSNGGSSGAQGSSVTLADIEPVGHYNPVAGYAATGVSPIYEGLLRPDAQSDSTLPELKPALASGKPTVSEDKKSWTVKLRKGVTFHDGSAFDSKDVAATYRAILNPKSASPIADDYKVIDSVETPDAQTVVFKLKSPNAGFASRLLLGIAPSDMLGSGNAEASALNTKPVGTGPFKLKSLSSNEATFEANQSYRGGKPQVQQLIIRHVADDNARMQQVMTGQVDGASLPPRLAESLKGKDGVTLLSVKSADWRAVSLPTSNPLTASADVRRALNVAVDQDALIESVLAGHGHKATNPITAAFPQHIDEQFTKANDVAKRRAEAEKMLDAAGWKKGADGVRTKNGQRAKLTLGYNSEDSLRRELASAFADQMKKIGVEVTTWGASWDDLEPKASQIALLLGGGDNPYTVDTQAYRALHSLGDATGPFDNPGRYSNKDVDAALDAARQSPTESAADPHYRDAQQAYVKDPGYVFLAGLSHTYAVRDTGFVGPKPIMEPHAHGSTWGPWWAIGQWKKK